jgi:hypothetical protein
MVCNKRQTHGGHWGHEDGDMMMGLGIISMMLDTMHTKITMDSHPKN